MKIKEITENKKDYMDILLVGDEEEAMINKYLDKGALFVLYDNCILVSACVVIQIDTMISEIKNLATYPMYQKRGYASKLLDFIFNKYKSKADYLILGTGENDTVLNFYKKKGFVETHRIKNFFTENYSHPIFENNKQLIDMIYLKKTL